MAVYRYRGDELPAPVEETGLALWGPTDLDLNANDLTKKRCDNCGAPATVAIRSLSTMERNFPHMTPEKSPTRRFYCGACRGGREVQEEKKRVSLDRNVLEAARKAAQKFVKRSK